MVRDYIIKTLLTLKEHSEKIHKLYTMGIDLSNFDKSISQLEESIPTILRKEKDKYFEYVDDLVGWWLYEDVEKKIWLDGVVSNVESVEDFTDYLMREYGTNEIPINYE